MNTEKMTTKNIITVVLLALVNVIIFGFGTFFYLTPITVLLMPVFYALFQGIVFFMLGTKVPKKGAIFLYCVIMGVIGFNIPYILMHLLAGLFAEWYLKKVGYGSMKGLTVSYIVLQLLAAVGSTIYPYAIVLNATLADIQDGGDLAVNIEAAGNMIRSWGMLVLVAGVILSAWIGALLGKKIVKKHLQSEEAL